MRNPLERSLRSAPTGTACPRDEDITLVSGWIVWPMPSKSVASKELTSASDDADACGANFDPISLIQGTYSHGHLTASREGVVSKTRHFAPEAQHVQAPYREPCGAPMSVMGH